MKKVYTHIFFVFLTCAACHKRELPSNGTVLGTITTDLNVNYGVVRKKEALAGNLICDAIFKNITARGKQIDGAIINSGSIRYNAQTRANGIYYAGPFTDNMVSEMIPFGDVSVIVKVNGKQLKEMFERSVSNYNQIFGQFLQVSSNFKVIIDTTKTAQLLTPAQTAIAAAGQRITSISLNTTLIDSTTTIYSIVVPSFMAGGGDGYTTLLNLAPNLQETIGDDQSNAVRQLLLTSSPITPILQNRLVFQ